MGLTSMLQFICREGIVVFDNFLFLNRMQIHLFLGLIGLAFFCPCFGFCIIKQGTYIGSDDLNNDCQVYISEVYLEKESDPQALHESDDFTASERVLQIYLPFVKSSFSKTNSEYFFVKKPVYKITEFGLPEGGFRHWVDFFSMGFHSNNEKEKFTLLLSDLLEPVEFIYEQDISSLFGKKSSKCRLQKWMEEMPFELYSSTPEQKEKVQKEIKYRFESGASSSLSKKFNDRNFRYKCNVIKKNIDDFHRIFYFSEYVDTSGEKRLGVMVFKSISQDSPFHTYETYEDFTFYHFHSTENINDQMMHLTHVDKTFTNYLKRELYIDKVTGKGHFSYFNFGFYPDTYFTLHWDSEYNEHKLSNCLPVIID